MITLAHLRVHNYKSLRDIDLAFPQRGSILVEGLNEAGKSTLFESVYVALYGEPLVAEEISTRGRGRFDSAIHYRADQALVALTLDVNGATLVVERTMKRGRPGDARLHITYPDGTDEAVTGIRAVNDRVVQELGNLDKETLLNSCFVEQKKLSKLEDLSGPARKESLEHLLNLDKLQGLQEEVRVTTHDKAAVQIAQQRLTLADTQAQIPVIAGHIATLQRQLAAVALHTALDSITEQEQRLAGLATRRNELDAHRAELQAVQQRINHVKLTRDTIRTLTAARRDLDRAAQEMAELTATLERLDHQEQAELPTLVARRQAIDDLHDALKRLQQQSDTLRDQHAMLADIDQQIAEIDRRTADVVTLRRECAALSGDVDEMARTIAEDEQQAQERITALTTRQDGLQQIIALFDEQDAVARELESAAQAVQTARAQVAAHASLLADINAHAADETRVQGEVQAADAAISDAQQVEMQLREADALVQWLTGQRDIAALSAGTATRDEHARRVASATTNHEQHTAAARKLLVPVVVLALMGIAGVLGGVILIALVDAVWGASLTGAGALCLLIAIVLAPRWRAKNQEVQAARAERDAARQAQSDFTAKQAAMEAMGGGEARVTAAERTLADMGAVVPVNVADAEARVASLRPADAPDIDTARAQVETLRHTRDTIRDQQRDVTARLSLLRDQSQQHPGAQPDVIAQAAADERPEGLVTRQEALERQIALTTTANDVAPEREQVQRALQSVSTDLEQERSRLSAIPVRRDMVTLKQQHLTQQQTILAEAAAWIAAHPRDAVEQTRQEQEAAIAQQEQVIAHERAAVEQAAMELAITPESGAVEQARGSLAAQIERLHDELATRPTRIAQQESLATQVAQERERLQLIWQEQQPLPDNSEAFVSDLPTVSNLADIETNLASILHELDEPQVLQRLHDLANEQGEMTAQERSAQVDMTQHQTEITQRLSELGVTAEPRRDAITAVVPEMQVVSRTDGERLAADLEDAKVELGAIRRRATELAGQLGLHGVTLDVETATTELETQQHNLRVKEQAERIVKGVRERMVQKVLPNTERNMCMLLPLLTADRYRDCQITPDYKLQVWDEGAGRYVAKNIFSGGTRDQLSLALRLAFALATLPEELGTTPGFIFLDEPLSSFDGPRTEALIALLTQGQIATNFSQIFVISHNRMFDRNAFTHHLTMEGGRVIEHDFDRVVIPMRHMQMNASTL